MPASSSSTLAGSLWLAAIGMFLILAGATFTWVLFTAWQRAEETRSWTPTPCRIISSKVISERRSPNAEIEHRTDIRYRYAFNGQSLTGNRIKRVNAATVHEESARKQLEEFPIGKEIVCYVNPVHPEQAVLKHDTRAALYTIWFPLLFVVGGMGIVWGALRRR